MTSLTPLDCEHRCDLRGLETSLSPPRRRRRRQTKAFDCQCSEAMGNRRPCSVSKWSFFPSVGASRPPLPSGARESSARPKILVATGAVGGSCQLLPLPFENVRQPKDNLLVLSPVAGRLDVSAGFDFFAKMSTRSVASLFKPVKINQFVPSIACVHVGVLPRMPDENTGKFLASETTSDPYLKRPLTLAAQVTAGSRRKRNWHATP